MKKTHIGTLIENKNGKHYWIGIQQYRKGSIGHVKTKAIKEFNHEKNV